ncbi:MATE family efflux transporter [Rheinheimera sp. MMS21-TC3]|uniref:MATE family efflux transporter n=1 Tax=Rheinheimera sp. MMS21-TC3 TaxID=3072790 RepID=UPI0028C473C9|nr:MATE family efflux transporter [Rheinheimera sp. MMS21-TC3]WNO61213.1 MATE family efflux transporter [Rheinheimera sp. MMS21-TC3]
MNSIKAPSALLKGDIKATMVAMTVPMLFGTLILMTFNIVDTFFISLLGTEPLAAISFTFPISFTLISLAIGLSIGTSAVIARALGQGKTAEARSDATVALALSCSIVALMSAAGYFFSANIFKALGASDLIYSYIQPYMDLWFLGSVLLVIPMIGNAILRAAGDTKIPSLIMGASGLVNAVLDPILIFGIGPIPAMHMHGAAMATVSSWLVGSIAMLYMLNKRNLIDLDWPSWSFLKVASKKILSIGLPAAAANMLTPLAMAILTAMMANYGAHAVAGFGVGVRLESIACLIVLTLSMTLPPFISQNFGAGFWHRVQQGYQLCGKFVLVWQLLVYLVLAILAIPLARLFSDEPEVIHIISLFLWIVPLGYGLQGITILTNSSFNALHLPVKAMGLSLVRLFVFYVPFAWLGGYLFGLLGLFVGCVLANACTASIAWHWFNQVVTKTAKMGDQVVKKL